MNHETLDRAVEDEGHRRAIHVGSRRDAAQDATFRFYNRTQQCIRLIPSNFSTYCSYPSWRVNGLMRTEPCLSGRQLADALDIVSP